MTTAVSDDVASAAAALPEIAAALAISQGAGSAFLAGDEASFAGGQAPGLVNSSANKVRSGPQTIGTLKARHTHDD